MPTSTGTPMIPSRSDTEISTPKTRSMPGAAAKKTVYRKTGTADRVGENGRYSGKTASFIGFAPADKPEFVVAVILQNPIRGYFGGVTAGPVFKDVMTYALQQFRIPPTGAPPPVMKLKSDSAPASADKAETALKAESGLQRRTSPR